LGIGLGKRRGGGRGCRGIGLGEKMGVKVRKGEEGEKCRGEKERGDEGQGKRN